MLIFGPDFTSVLLPPLDVAIVGDVLPTSIQGKAPCRCPLTSYLRLKLGKMFQLH